MKKLLGISCLLIMLMSAGLMLKAADGYNSDSYVQPLFELRGAWVATVSNIDVTKQYGTDETAINNYKNQYTAILNTLEKMKMNAVFFQVRPANDAFYPSQYNAWSMFLVGDGVNPGWNPLAWMVEETHKRGMEFHAWLNPYRVSSNEMTPSGGQSVEDMKWSYILNRQSKVEGQNIRNPLYKKVTKGSQAYSDLMEEIVYGKSENKLFLNPAKQETIDFISQTINEIITDYEVDGIHFDDYFYPSGGIETAIDNKDYLQYGSGFTDISAWRRNNVDRMVKAVHDVVEDFNNNTTRSRKVRFGISPAAVWAPRKENCSATSGRGVEGGMDVGCGNYSSYHDLNADTRKWVLEEWIDYILPQAYMTFESYYKPVVSWWANTVRGTHVKLYVGLAPYRYLDSEPWDDEYQIAKQVVYNNTLPEVSGTVFFSYKNLAYTGNDWLNMARWYVKQLWKRPALPPVYRTDAPDVDPAVVTGTRTSTSHTVMFYEAPDALGYILYRFTQNEEISFTNDKIYQVLQQTGGSGRRYITVTDTADYRYVLKTVDQKGTFSDTGEVYNSADFAPNTPPVIEDFRVDGAANILVGSDVSISFKANDAESENLDVNLFLYQGADEEFSVKLVPGNDGNYEYIWKSYLIDYENLMFKVTASDGTATVEIASAPFNLVSELKQKAPKGYTVAVKEGMVRITGLENAEYSLDGINYYDLTEFEAPDKEFVLYLRVKASSGLEASDPVTETIVNTVSPSPILIVIGAVIGGAVTLGIIGVVIFIIKRKGGKSHGTEQI